MSLFNLVKSKISIVDVVGEYTALKRAGSYLKGNCPIHQEKTPSFTVTPHRDIFYCFGCHAGGDVIAFVAGVERCSQWEAAQHLVTRHNIEVPPESPHQERESAHFASQQRHFKLCALVGTWCHQELAASPRALAYVRSRTITEASIDRFRIGLFPGGPEKRHALLQYLKEHGFLLNDLLGAHIFLKGSRGHYSPFEDRLIFPIADQLGRPCGFGGRVIIADDKRPKYYNSHDHPHFSKRELLFGADLAKRAIQQEESVYITEGYTDCIALAQAGHRNVVATLGTACSAEQLTLLRRYTQKIVVMYDGDRAGIEAMLKLGQACWNADLDLAVIQLPATHDPASFIASGGSLAQHQARDLFSFYLATIGPPPADAPLPHKIHQIRDMIQMITKVHDPLKQEMLIHQASQAWDIPMAVLARELSRMRAAPTNAAHSQPSLQPARTTTSTRTPPAPQRAAKTQTGITGFAREVFCAIISSRGRFSSEELMTAYTLLPAAYASILRAWDMYCSTEIREFSDFFTQLAPEEKERVLQACHGRELDAPSDSTDHRGKLVHAELQRRRWRSILKSMQLELQEAHAANNMEHVARVMQTFQALKHAMQEQGLL